MSDTPARVAVIGLGSMGYGMAQALRRAGLDVAGSDVAEGNVARFSAEGGRGAGSPAEAAADAAIVVCVVVNAAQTEAVLFGPDGRRFLSYVELGRARDAAERQAEQERRRAEVAEQAADRLRAKLREVRGRRRAGRR